MDAIHNSTAAVAWALRQFMGAMVRDYTRLPRTEIATNGRPARFVLTVSIVAPRTAPPSLGILTRTPFVLRTLLDSNIPVRERGIQIDHYPCCAQYCVPRTDGLVVVI